MNLRTDESLRDRLQAAADKNGVSVNKEMDERLKRSFEMGPDLFETKELFGIAELIAVAVQKVNSQAAFYASPLRDHQFWIDHQSHFWMENAYAYDQVIKAVQHILETFRPEGDPSAPSPRVANPDGLISDIMPRLGITIAKIVLAEVRAGKSHFDSEQNVTELIRDGLGSLANRIRVESYLQQRDGSQSVGSQATNNEERTEGASTVIKAVDNKPQRRNIRTRKVQL
jgi:hypothetical protein